MSYLYADQEIDTQDTQSGPVQAPILTRPSKCPKCYTYMISGEKQCEYSLRSFLMQELGGKPLDLPSKNPLGAFFRQGCRKMEPIGPLFPKQFTICTAFKVEGQGLGWISHTVLSIHCIYYNLGAELSTMTLDMLWPG